MVAFYLAPSQLSSFLNTLRESFMVCIFVNFETVVLYLLRSRSHTIIWMSTIIDIMKLNPQETVTAL